MRRIVSTSLMVALFVLPAEMAAQSPIAEEAIAEVRTYVRRLEALGLGGVLVVTERGRPLLVEAAGTADRETERAWTPATVSTIGSITKQFTGAGILLLAERNELEVDDPITGYFDGVPADKRGITLHHLLTHSSGIVDLEGVGDFDPIDRDEFVRRILAQELVFTPGEGYRYSNAGYSLLGAVIEQLGGESYETWLRRNLLLPHGLYETGYLEPEWGEGRLAQGYRDGERWGTVLERPMREDGPNWVLRANGGLHSTAWDMVRWGQALLHGRVLSGESMALYWTPHVDEGGGESFYGYGWVVLEAGGSRVVTHNGGNGIFFADMAMVPDADLILFLMTNVVADFPPAGQLLERVGDRLLAGRPLPEVPELVVVGPAELEPFTGSYRLEGEAGGRLVVAVTERADGTPELTVEPLDTVAFGRLLSTRPWDPARAERLSARIDAIVGALLAGDAEPLASAYGDAVTAEYLAQRWAELRGRLEERHGALRGHRILGTAMRDGRDVTLARIEFANGSVDRAYVWDPEAETELLGTSQRGLEDRAHVLPGPDGRFATWDPRVGQSRPVRFESVDGGYRVVIGEEPRVTAVETPD